MSDHDETVIAELRRCREGLKVPTPAERPAWTMKLTMEEVDALLRAVDERDELRRQGVGDFETGFVPMTVEHLLPINREEIPVETIDLLGALKDSIERRREDRPLSERIAAEHAISQRRTLPADEGGPLDPGEPWIGRSGHAWPCPLFYVGNWRNDRPARDCIGGECESTA